MSRLHVDGHQPMQAEGEPPFTMDGWVDTAPFEQYLGIEIVEAKNGTARLRLPFTVHLAQGAGLLHGGAITALGDTAVAMAIKSLLPEGTRFATTELTTRFLAPVREGVVTARAEVTGPEGRTFYGKAILSDPQGREIAHFASVFRVAQGQGGDA